MILLLLACTPEPATAGFTLDIRNLTAPGDLVTSAGVVRDILFAPGVWVVHEEGWRLFEEGQAASAELEPLAEDGDPAKLLARLDGEAGVVAFGVTGNLDGVTYANAPLMPGESASEAFDAVEGERLTVATMYGESNDVFVASEPGGIALFAEGEPLTGAIALGMYDAGTEVNQESGMGADQAPAQDAPNTGATEGGVVSTVVGEDVAGYPYPLVDDVISAELLVIVPAEG